jgi:hypothetical protein
MSPPVLPGARRRRANIGEKSPQQKRHPRAFQGGTAKQAGRRTVHQLPRGLSTLLTLSLGKKPFDHKDFVAECARESSSGRTNPRSSMYSKKLSTTELRCSSTCKLFSVQSCRSPGKTRVQNFAAFRTLSDQESDSPLSPTHQIICGSLKSRVTDCL